MNHKLTTWTAALLFAAVVPAQRSVLRDALDRAVLLQRQEGDLSAAEKAYRELLAGHTDGAVAQEAALHLGGLLWQLDKKEEARPFLQQAAAAGGEVGKTAQALLDGQDPQSKQGQQRLAEARELVNRLHTIVWSQHNAKSKEIADGFGTARTTLTADLLRCGDAGAVALLEQLDDVARKDDVTTYYQDPDKLAFSALLWQFDTPAARDYLGKVAAQGPLEWQRFLTKPVKEQRRVPRGLLPAVLAFAQVADPAGLVQDNLHASMQGVETAQVMQLLEQGPQARNAAFLALASRWPGLDATEREGLLDRIRTALPQDLGTENAAWQLAYRMGADGPRSAQRVLLERLATSSTELIRSFSNATRWTLGDKEMALLLAACRHAGALPERDNGSNGLAELFRTQQCEWTERSLDAVREIVALGYARRDSGQMQWLWRYLQMATPAQQAGMVRAMPQLQNWQNVLSSLGRAPVPHEVARALVEVTDGALRTYPERWDMHSENQGAKVPGNALHGLLATIAMSGLPEAPAWFEGLLAREPWTARAVAHALVLRPWPGDAEAARRGLRTLLVWATPTGTYFDAETRNEVFAALARCGDEPAIALYPRAYALGLRPVQYRGAPQTQWQGRGLQFLGMDCSTPQALPCHGYDDTQLAAAWQLLLDCEQQDEVWADLRDLKDRVPVAALPLVAARLPQRLASVDAKERNDLASMLVSFRRVAEDDLTKTPALREAIAGLLRTDDARTAGYLLAQLREAVAARFLDDARALLGRTSLPADVAFKIRRSGAELRTEDWLRALEDSRWESRKYVLTQLPLPLDPKLAAKVDLMLRSDAEPAVRVAAADTLARLTAAEAVPTLLQAMWDESPNVAKAATDALERIRFHQEQQVYWKNARAGIDVSTTSATAKLLMQAGPDQPKDQRLLAIGSLAALGAPTALPYLIEWSKDQDGEIAAAAKASLTAILARNK